MSNELTNKPTNTGLSTTGNSGNLLNEVMKTLPPEQQEKLRLEQAKALMRVQENELGARLRHDASTVEMIRHVDVVKEHEKLKSDYTVKSTFKTASGETQINVSKRNNMTVIVIAVVVAVIFFAMFSK